MEYINSKGLKLESNERILDLLSGNKETVRKIARFQVAIKHLVSNQKKLEDSISLSGRDISGIEQVKNESRVQLEESVIVVIRILQVFAHDRQKRNLQMEIYHLTSESIKNCLDLELIKISKKIWLILNKYGTYSPTFINRVKALLKPDDSKDAVNFEKEYGLSEQMIKQLEETMIRFIENMLLFEAELKKKEKADIRIKKVNKKIKKLLVNKIDRFILLVEQENPDFYEQYRELRDKQMSKNGKESLTLESDPIDDPTEEIPSKKVKKKTKSKKLLRSKLEIKKEL